MVFVPQVAPYVDGPAGVHGVLDQAATAAAQLADLQDCATVVAPDVREMDDGLLARARVLALFTIGETPWSGAQRATIMERVRAGSSPPPSDISPLRGRVRRTFVTCTAA